MRGAGYLLLLVFAIPSCAQQENEASTAKPVTDRSEATASKRPMAPTSYIVTMPGVGRDIEQAREICQRTFPGLQITGMQALKADTFVVSVENASNLADMQRQVATSPAISAIQRNQDYRIPPSPQPGVQLRALPQQ